MRKGIIILLALLLALSAFGCGRTPELPEAYQSRSVSAQTDDSVGRQAGVEADTLFCNLLDTSTENIQLNSLVSSDEGSNCFTPDSCLTENSSYASFLTPIPLEVGKSYKLARDGSDSSSWYTSVQYAAFYDANGNFLLRESTLCAFSLLEGCVLRVYTSPRCNSYLDTQLDAPPAYLMLSCGKGTMKTVSQLRVLANERVDVQEYVPYQNGEAGQPVEESISAQQMKQSVRVLFVSDLHFNSDDPESKDAGVSSLDRAQMLVDAVNAEHEKSPVDALIFLGDFEKGYGTGAAEYFAEHYAPQLKMPFYAFPGEHDMQTNEQWQAIWGTERSASVEVGGFCFLFADGYKDSWGEPDDQGTRLRPLDEASLTERIEKAEIKGDIPFLMCHSKSAVTSSDFTTDNWRSFMKKHIRVIFYAHTHEATISDYANGTVYLLNSGNFSFPNKGDWANLTDENGDPVNRWSFLDFQKQDDVIVLSRIYPKQTLEIDGNSTEYAYEIRAIGEQSFGY